MKRILGTTVGSCVHVAGVMNFLNIAKSLGYETRFVGSAVDIDRLIDEIKSYNPDIVGISYRLTPESAVELFGEFEKKIAEVFREVSFILGTTAPVAELLKKENLLKMFDTVFTGGESRDDIAEYLQGKKLEDLKDKIPPQNLIERISFKKPFPILRHHFGRPTMEETVEGIGEISESRLIDVVSLGPDQNTQEFFFKPEKMDKLQDGAGGVPIRSEDDLKALFNATRTGNYPIMRCYSGTNDIMQFAEILRRNINNAWCAVPLCWYNELDNRSERKLVESISENQQVMKWHGERGIPVEVNESHHWSLRYASDAIAVVSAYLAAYSAKRMGVKHYVAQYMFNTPPETSFVMDLAKMLAKVEMIESLHDENFTTIRQTRSGLFSMPTNFNKGKGQLASSTLLQMQLDPSIVHVVAFCESSYAAKPEDIIESSEIVTKVIENYISGCPDMKIDRSVIDRKKILTEEANLILNKIGELDTENEFEDPLSEPAILGKAIKIGIMDAPHLEGVPGACGKIKTMFFDGANMPVDDCGNMIGEAERLKRLGC
jgi:hypothetical protein